MALETQALWWTGDRYTPGSGAAQTWTFPPGVHRVWVALWGGGVTSTESSENRTICARIDRDAPGETLQIRCGGSNRYQLTWSGLPQPIEVAGGWNGGGTGWHSTGGSSGVLGSGGGATDVRRGSYTLDDRIVVAGGMGGSSGGAGAPGDANEYVVQTGLVPSAADPTRVPRAAPTVIAGSPVTGVATAPSAGGEAVGADGTPTPFHGAAGGGGAGGGASGGVYETTSSAARFEPGRPGGFYAHPGCPIELPPGLDELPDHPGVALGGVDVWGGAARIWWEPPTVTGWSIDAIEF